MFTGYPRCVSGFSRKHGGVCLVDQCKVAYLVLMEEHAKWKNNIWKYRMRAGLSQKRVAILMGLKSASHVSDWEKGVKLPSLANAFKLAYVLNILPLELFCDLARAMQQEVIRQRLNAIIDPNAKSKNQPTTPASMFSCGRETCRAEPRARNASIRAT